MVTMIEIAALSIECDGCGAEKDYASVVCCDDCWERLPLDICTAFKNASASFSGADPAEVTLRQWLVDNRKGLTKGVA
jgi:hypothetical protein